MNNVKDKVVFITGASSGYGKAMAELFVKEGAKVIIASRNEEELKAVQKEIGCAGYVRMDVTKIEDWLSAEKYIIDNFNKIDVLVNNAGAGISIKDTIDQDFDTIDYVLKLNLNSVIYGSKIFARYMKEQQSGTIINVASVCATHCWPGWGIYGAAKAGVLNFSKSLYLELQKDNVRVTCLIPASSNTKFADNAGISVGKLAMQPKDVGETVLYICNLPNTVVVEELTVWGIDQVVNPL